MRKTFKLLAVAMALVLCAGLQSCQNTEEVPHGYPILFRCMDETRAETTVATMKADEKGFNVYAFFNAPAANGVTFNKNVWYDEGKDMWIYNDVEYWIPGATYYFKAVYPAGIASVDNDDTTQAVTIYGFDITKQQDILVATTDRNGLEVDDNGNPTGGSMVRLQFQHLLANVMIKIKSQIDGVAITSVKLGNLDNNSTYNGSTWLISGNTTYVDYTEPTTLTKGADLVDVTGGGFLVIPANSNEKTLTIEANKTYNLTIPNGKWEIGKRYTYTIEIKQDDIVFVDDAPYVEEWDSENATGSVIIK